MTTREEAAALRAPFPADKIGKLPRVTCPKCRESRDRSCDEHKKSSCGECHAWITSKHIHLDYVGHADVTDRMLEVDPDWTWEPFALDARGLPAIDDNGGMWIRLTIAGTTRIGYGDADGKKGANAVKEMIGDALRNAGQRFGIALDLWRKEPPTVEESRPRRERQERQPETPTPEQAAEHKQLLERIKASTTEAMLNSGAVVIRAAFKGQKLTPAQANGLLAQIDERRRQLAPADPAPDPVDDEPVGPPPIEPKTRGRLFALLNEHDYKTADERRAYASVNLGREVTSMTTLTETEGRTLIELLAAKPKKREEAPV